MCWMYLWSELYTLNLNVFYLIFILIFFLSINILSYIFIDIFYFNIFYLLE